MIQPGAENPQAAKLASMFMGNDVVRIVRPNAVISILPDKFPRNKLAGHSSIFAVGSLPGSSENLVEVLFLHRTYFSDQIFKFGFRAQLDLIPREIHDIVLSDVIADGVEELGTNDFCRSRHFWIGRRIKF